VPDRDVHLDPLAVRHVEDDLALRHLRSERRDVAVVEVVLDEPADEGRLADRGLADQTDLRLNPLHLGHGGHGSIPSGLLKTSAKKVEPREPFSPRSSSGRRCDPAIASSWPWTSRTSKERGLSRRRAKATSMESRWTGRSSSRRASASCASSR